MRRFILSLAILCIASHAVANNSSPPADLYEQTTEDSTLAQCGPPAPCNSCGAWGPCGSEGTCGACGCAPGGPGGCPPGGPIPPQGGGCCAPPPCPAKCPHPPACAFGTACGISYAGMAISFALVIGLAAIILSSSFHQHSH